MQKFCCCLAIVMTAFLTACGATQVGTTTDGYLYNEAFGKSGKAETLAVFIHGDSGRGSGGWMTDYMFTEAQFISTTYPDVVGVGILRPGFRDIEGNRSPGANYGGFVLAATQEANDAIARTIVHLKEKHGAKRVIGIGHSGGAVILGVLIGSHPGLFDGVVLVGMVCDLWKMTYTGGYRVSHAKGPVDYVDDVPQGTVIRTITGERDTLTKPLFAQNCVSKWKERGLDAEAIIVPGANHRYEGALRNKAREVVGEIRLP